MSNIRHELPGQWAIVSTFNKYTEARGEALQALHDEAIAAASAGIQVEILTGMYDGRPVASLKLYGPRAYARAKRLALDYNQEVFMAHDDGSTYISFFDVDGKEVDTITHIEFFDNTRTAGNNYTVTGAGVVYVLK